MLENIRKELKKQKNRDLPKDKVEVFQNYKFDNFKDEPELEIQSVVDLFKSLPPEKITL